MDWREFFVWNLKSKKFQFWMSAGFYFVWLMLLSFGIVQLHAIPHIDAYHTMTPYHIYIYIYHICHTTHNHIHIHPHHTMPYHIYTILLCHTTHIPYIYATPHNTHTDTYTTEAHLVLHFAAVVTHLSCSPSLPIVL